MTALEPIPGPPPLPLIGNLLYFTGSIMADCLRLMDDYGPITKFRIGSMTMVLCGNHAYASELCDEKRFKKSLKNVLRVVRDGAHDGLFTASGDEPNWGKAHRVLIPAFGPLPIRGMFDDMHDIAAQLCMKWARHGPAAAIEVTDDFTRLALDTISLCSMDFRFNSYYSEELHPFIRAMGDFLTECSNRNRRPGFTPDFLYRAANDKFFADIDTMKNVADELVQARRRTPSGKKDLLGAMLEGIDPTTGEKLSDDNISSQLITFLIAGHETTSGTLSFSFYNLLKNPETYRRAQEEVDQVIGQGPVRLEHLNKLHYLAGVLRETLRLSSPIPSFALEAIKDTVIGGKYFLQKGDLVSLFLPPVHRDPSVYGDDADEFKPERMMEENFQRLLNEFPDCWKPFGNGQRACIGRPFAWQEMLLAMAMLLQNFEFEMDDPDYKLEIQQTLTIKPKGFRMRGKLRHGLTATALQKRLAGTGGTQNDASRESVPGGSTPEGAVGTPLAVYYGSNSGTCEALAQRLAGDAPAHGFRATMVAPLDEARDNLPKDRPMVIVTASYEGQPPGNAASFIRWMENLKGREMESVNYAVFACGHRDWAQTFHRIPKLINTTLEERGGTRLVVMGSADASRSDMFGDFEAWEDDILWPALKKKFGTSRTEASDPNSGLSVQVTNNRKTTLRQDDIQDGVVVAAKILTASGPEKRHIEIQLPSGSTYTAGDYLAILPLNPKEVVLRVLRRFQLTLDAALKIQSDGPTTLPTDGAVTAFDIFSAYVELSQPATKRNISALIDATDDSGVVVELRKLSGDDFYDNITAKRVSVLDLLERFPSIGLPVGSYLAMLPPMRVRQYSISSSPLANPATATLTYSILDAPSLSGQGRHVGVATRFLAELSPGDKLHVAVRPSHAAFHLPVAPETTPIICVAAGSGLAPFRGFIQELAAMLAAGRHLAPALLFLGCRAPAVDALYADELARWATLGAVDVRYAYSRASKHSQGCKYVQDRLWRDATDVLALWDRGAHVYVCGSHEMSKGVDEVFVKLLVRSAEAQGRTVGAEEAQRWFEGLRNVRYATDVFD